MPKVTIDETLERSMSEPTIKEAITWQQTRRKYGCWEKDYKKIDLAIRALEEMRERENKPWPRARLVTPNSLWLSEDGGTSWKQCPIEDGFATSANPEPKEEKPFEKKKTWDRVTLGEVVEFMDCMPAMLWHSKTGWRNDTLVSLGESVLGKKEPDPPFSTWRSLT